MKKPFIDYYNKYNIIPTSQNVKNVKSFLYQRNHLYSNLGIPLSFFSNKNIIEFGPGGGWNAQATSFFRPRSYTFVDGSEKSIYELRKKIKNKKINAKVIKLIKRNIFNFKTKKKYDIAIVEGTIPNQKYPNKMLKIISKCVKNGGVLITTTHSPFSLLSEVCRRLLRIKIYNSNISFENRLKTSCKIFKSHLATLKTTTRPVKDWVSDVILHDHSFENKYDFDTLDTLKCLEKNFYFYNSHPKFLIDDTWHKHIKNQNHTNKIYKKQHILNSLFLIDYRLEFKNFRLKKNTLKKIKNMEKLSRKLIIIHNKIIKDNNYKQISEFLKNLEKLNNLLPNEFKQTKKSIKNYIVDLPKYIKNNKGKLFIDFKVWWGRGMQYSSYVKKLKI